MSRTSRWSRLLLALVLLAAAIVLASRTLAWAGTWLVVEDPLQPARSVVVLGGQLPMRAMEAADVYKQGWTREVWLTQGGVTLEGLELEKLGVVEVPEQEYSRQVLEKLNVPADAIRVLSDRDVNTADEVRTIARELEGVGGDRVIVVTSKYHARRVKVLWRALVGTRPEIIVRYASHDPFEPALWWRDTGDAMSVVREWFGLLNAWTGFPVKSER